jgi:hypothetical protein
VKAPSTLDCTILHTTLLAYSLLVLPEDQDLVPPALFVAMAQLQACHLAQLDRVGCYKVQEIGFVGLVVEVHRVLGGIFLRVFVV